MTWPIEFILRSLLMGFVYISPDLEFWDCVDRGGRNCRVEYAHNEWAACAFIRRDMNVCSDAYDAVMARGRGKKK